MSLRYTVIVLVSINFMLCYVMLVTFRHPALRQNGWISFHDIFRIGPLWHKEQSGTLWGWCFWPLEYRVYFPIFWVCVCYQPYGITDGLIFMKFSGYGHKKELARLFHAWLDCFPFLKQGTVEVCAFGVLLFIDYILGIQGPPKLCFVG